MAIDEKIYTISEAAKYAEVSTKTIHRHIKSGKLEAAKNVGDYGPEWQITQTDLDNWLDDRMGHNNAFDPSDDHHKQHGQTRGGLVPWEDVQRLQENLVGAARTIGKLEATVDIQAQEIERLQSKINEIEKQAMDSFDKALDERIDNVVGQQLERTIQSYDFSNEEIKKLLYDSATTQNELKELKELIANKKPWWKLW